MTNHEPMFYDERINRICGRAYRTGILLAVLYTLLFGLCRFMLLGRFRWDRSVTDLFIILTGIALLLIGTIRRGFAKDERVEFEQHNFYLRAGKIFVVASLLGYALSIPQLKYQWAYKPLDYSADQLILHLLTLGCVYFFCVFKRHQVSFNYAFIDAPSAVYYRRVLLNVAKLAGILLLPFGLGVLSDMARHGAYLLTIVLRYAISVGGLSLSYLLLSVLEKCNNRGDEAPLWEDHPSHRLMGRGTAWAFATVVLVLLVKAALRLYLSILASQPPRFMAGNRFSALNDVLNGCQYPTLILAALAFSFLMEQHIRSKRVRMGICGILSLRAVSMVQIMTYPCILRLLERNFLTQSSYEILQIYSHIQTATTVCLWVLTIAFSCLLIYGLIRDCGASPLLWLTVGIEIFQQVAVHLVTAHEMSFHEGMIVTVVIAESCRIVIALLWFLLLLRRGKGQAQGPAHHPQRGAGSSGG